MFALVMIFGVVGAILYSVAKANQATGSEFILTVEFLCY